MLTGLIKAQLHLQGIDSLKQKRSIVKSLTGRLRSRFNVSCSEVGSQDNLRLGEIGIAIVSNETGYIDSQLDKVINFMQNDGRFYLGQIEREIFC